MKEGCESRQESRDRRRGLVGERVGRRAWMEGVGAVVEHFLGVVVSADSSLDAQGAKHGVGFPAPQELDSVGVDAGAEEGGRAARAKRAGADESGRDAGGGLK